MKGWGIALGIAAFAVLLALPPPAGLNPVGWRVAALLAWMILWWLTEAAPLAATALLPMIVLPLLGAGAPDAVARTYAAPLIGLVFGGALIATAAGKVGLHRRLGRLAVRVGGGGPRRLVLAVMAATAILALCMATSVVTIMMLQLAAVIVAAVAGEADTPDAQRFARAMILGVAYAAAFGGLGSLIGSPVNAAAAGLIARQTGERIDFAGWLVFGLPIAATAVLVTWGLLVAGTQRFALNLPDRGALLAFLGGGEPMQSAERRVLAVALITLAALAAVPLIKTWAPGASDAAVALVGALVLFLLPSGKVKSERLLTWTDAREAPWGVLIVIGGALALSAAMTDTGLAAWLASPLRGLAGVPPAIALLVLVAGAAVLTEFVNNFAAAAIIVPAAAATAAAVGADPVPFAIAVAIAAAGGFVVPGPPWLTLAVGTPPVRLPDLARTGVWLLPAAVLIETAICLMVGAARRG